MYATRQAELALLGIRDAGRLFALLALIGAGLRVWLAGLHHVSLGAPLGIACFLLAGRTARRWGTSAGIALLCAPLLLLPLHAGLAQRAGAATPSIVLLVFAPLLATHLAGVRAGAVASGSVIAVLGVLMFAPSEETTLPREAADRLRLIFVAVTALVGWLAIVRSRAERDRALAAAMSSQQAAERANAELESLLDHAPVTIVIKDRTGRYLRANPAFRALLSHWFGHPVDPIGQRQADLDPESGAVMSPRDEKVWTTGQVQAFEDTFHTPVGEQNMLVTLFPIRDAQGKQISLGAIAQNITGRVQAEAALRDAKQVLERSNRELQDFAAVVAHDLKAPARTVALLAEMLEEDLEERLGAEEADALRRLVHTTHHMTALVDRVLAYSSVGRAQLEPERVVIEELLQAVLATRAQARGDARIELDCGGLSVIADRAQLHQLFDNLIGNALKYAAPERAIRVHVGARETAEGICISVRDNGIGMADEDLPRIFEPFTRLARSRDREGSGVGLATCARIVERHGGRLWAESVEGEGSTFHLLLPRHPATADTRAA